MKSPVFFVCFLAVFLFFAVSVSAAQAFYLLEIQDDFSTLPGKPFPGDNVSLVVTIKNLTSNVTAFDVNAGISLNEEVFESIKSFEPVGNIQSDQVKQVGFKFRIKESAIPGTYRIPVTLSYLSSSSLVTDSFDLNILVNECFALDVKDIFYSPAKVYGGNKVSIKGFVENACSGFTRQVSVELLPVTNDSFDPFIVLSSNRLEIGTVPPFESRSFSFVLEPSANADPAVYVFEINASCLDCGSAASDKVSFEVLGKPWVIISGTDLSVDARADSKNLLQGDAFSFSVQVDNIGREKAKAVKVLLETTSDITGAVESFIGNIDPDDSSAAVFDLGVKQDASLGAQPVKILVEYFDETDSNQVTVHDFVFFINARPPESPVLLIVLLIVLFGVMYFVLRLVFRQLSLRKAKLQ
ncbi:MAG: hypothetical protein HY392_01060 [Candidatus Diapherotrites archaeon]|nr:hypothetical protein [Candidatus Diapherotrites archaeon]